VKPQTQDSGKVVTPVSETVNAGPSRGEEQPAAPAKLPLLPLRDIVVFPHMVVPLFVGREKSIAAIENAMAADKQIVLATQRRSSIDDPQPDDLYGVGVRAEILQVLKLPDNTVKILVEGVARVRLAAVELVGTHLAASPEPIEAGPAPAGRETEALRRSVNEQFEKYVKLSRKIPPELLVTVAGILEPDKLADTVSANLLVKNHDKQALLETVGTEERLEQLLRILGSEIEIMLVERKIHSKVKKQMEKTQKEYYLVEQMKAIQKELGKKDEFKSEIEELRARVKAAKMSDEATEKATRELKKIEMMPPLSAEATVVRNYLDWLVSLPWSVRTKDKLDVRGAAKILDEDHTGLEKVK
jgi:ATP-dependent Lon protease